MKNRQNPKNWLDKRIVVGILIPVLIAALFLGFNPANLKANNIDTRVYISYNAETKIPQLHTVGIGKPPRKRSLSHVQRKLLAKRAAIVNGYRNLLRTVEGHPHWPKEGIVQEFHSGYLKGVEVGETRIYPEGKVEVEMFLPLHGRVESFEKVRTQFSDSGLPIYEIDRQKRSISKEEYNELFRPRRLKREVVR